MGKNGKGGWRCVVERNRRAREKYHQKNLCYGEADLCRCHAEPVIRNGLHGYICRVQKSETTKRVQADLGPEARKARIQKALNTLGPEGRKARSILSAANTSDEVKIARGKKGGAARVAKMTKEELVASAKLASDSMPLEARREQARKLNDRFSPEEKRAMGLNLAEWNRQNTTPQERSERTSRGVMSIPPERRKANSAKANLAMKERAVRETGIQHPTIALSEFTRRRMHENVMARAKSRAESMYDERSAE